MLWLNQTRNINAEENAQKILNKSEEILKKKLFIYLT